MQQIVFSQEEYSFSGAHSTGKAHTSITDENIWALQNNPAAFAFAPKISAGVSCKNYYGLRDISHIQGDIGYISNWGAYGISNIFWGNEHYKTSVSSITFAKKITERISGGIKFNYMFFQKEMAEYSNNSIFPEIAFFAKPIDDFYYGIHIIQPFQNTQKTSANKSMYKIGCSYMGIENFTISTLINKVESECIVFHIGAEYKIIKKLQLELGYSNSLTPISFGIGYVTPNFEFNYASELHSFLGFSHTISFTYCI